ncbi:MAG: tRNA (guanosine(46)-N7)-methyltransferase TrmB, partial [Campylobacteraceae bacterium 4484_166]
LKTNSIVAIELFQDEQYFKNLQNNYDNIFMEIGFGSGRHIINKAIQNPTFLYIGVEIYTASIEQLNNLINIQNINNIIIVHYDARQLLNIFPAKYLETIYIHFPVPWDDKPHRRVINKDFINQVIRTLKTNGSLNLRTDSLKYYEYCKQLLDCYDNIQTKINNNIDIASKYEDRWKKLKKNIYDITFINKNSDFIDNSRYDFVFLDKITKISYDKKKAIIQNTSFAIKKRDFIFISGTSGSGKSTILNSLYGDIKPLAGQLMVKNIDMENIKQSQLMNLRKDMGIVFQDYKLIKEKTVEENIMLPLQINGYTEELCDSQATKLLEHVRLGQARYAYPDQLSGGEQQRVSVARALAHN